MRLWAVLLLALLATAFAAEESCMGRCENGFDSQKNCQCDSMCKYYKSCCYDYEATCRMNSKLLLNWCFSNPLGHVLPMTHAAPVTTTAPPTTTTTAAPDPDAETCSGRPFDSFMQLKNGSIYAFRGEYFFELDQKSVLPGYPKLIKDVWGISGPIDAAFTRVNCQGKTYIFKGNKYWRFDNGVLDPDYPRDITVGFDNIPDHLDAAFALPAPNHHGKEKVYFFKGDQYYLYEFLHQPSHEECITISETSPSMLFRRYTDMYYNNYEPFFSELFAVPQHHSGHHFINRDWKGIKSPVDAVMAGRIYVGPWSPPPRRNDYRFDQQWGQQQGQQWNQQYGQQWDQQYGQQWGRRRQNDRAYWDFISRSQPLQSVYFFKGDKYYRVDLRTKRVDPAVPPYPRSIAKYWLGCSDTTGAEK
uniref:Vitronectin a n=1 Tax=Myripristis murdjan TaxID=586833 RepID=A0A667XCD7_9TELE